MVWVEKFFCLKLRTAALVAAWLDIFKAIVSLIILGILVGQAGEMAKDVLELNPQLFEGDREYVTKLIKGVVISLIVYVCVCLLFTVLLLFGIIKRVAGYMVPWLVLTGIGLVINFITLLWKLPGIFSSGDKFGGFIGNLITSLLVAYYYAAVVSYYQTLKAELRGHIRNHV